MKLFEHNQGNANATEAGSWYYTAKVVEFNDKIYLREQGHTKSELIPQFNDWFGYSAYGHALHLYNKVGCGVTQHAPGWHKGMNSSHVHYNSTPGRTYHVTNNDGQLDACAAIDGKGFRVEPFFRSSNGYTYYSEWNRNDNEMIFKIDSKTNKKVSHHVSNSTAYQEIKFMHEDDTYLYGFNACQIYSYPGMVRVHKETCVPSRMGFHNRHWFGYQPIYKNNDYILNFCWEYNYSHSQPGFHLDKLHWDDSHTSSSGRHLRIDGIDHNYTALQWISGNGSGGTNTTLSTREVIYYPMQDDHRLSDDNLFIPKDAFYAHAGAAMVADETLRNTHNVGRLYVAYFEDSTVDESEPISILRINVPIGDIVEDAPEYDVRKCELDHSGATDPDTGVPTYVNVYKEGGPTGAASYGYLENNLLYFTAKDASNVDQHYLLLTFEISSGWSMHGTHSSTGDRFYVYRIEDHSDSMTDNVQETDSIKLKLVQAEELEQNYIYKFFPNGYAGGFHKFVLINSGSSTHNPIFMWDPSSENFITDGGPGILGNITEIGEDSTGRIWTTKYPQDSGEEMKQQIHIDSLEMPADIKITPELVSYEYIDSNIDTYVDVGVYNSSGERLQKNVTLTMTGTGVTFQGGGTTKIITSNTSNDARVNITISSATKIQIKADIN